MPQYLIIYGHPTNWSIQAIANTLEEAKEKRAVAGDLVVYNNPGSIHFPEIVKSNEWLWDWEKKSKWRYDWHLKKLIPSTYALKCMILGWTY